ncbi:DNA-methyltransferase [Enterobacter asburiae]|uniref:DNA-methyltransferase n=1 Tax=Enterobacter asburiae TaxID=61645 RepID=UPI0027E8AD4C|nr:site-specific DNA-methyltransferase [Enterobacter asburiae]
MQKKTQIKGAQLVCADSLQFIKTIPDNSVNLIAVDPPYFGVKTNDWDNQWESDAEFLGWLDEFLAEFWRILAPNGSLYMFSGSRLAAKIELLTRDRFNVLNHITWAKPSGVWKRQNKESLRAFFPATERIIFAEHYGASGYAKGQSGYASKCADLQKDIFAPLIELFASARRQLGISAADINAATGKQMCSHWFSASQWRLPSLVDFHKLQALFQRRAEEMGVACPPPFNVGYAEHQQHYAELKQSYESVKGQYDDLKAQYENLRRPFSVTADVPYTDVWEYKPVQYYPGKHPCEKPAEMMEHIIRSSSCPGDVVADFFMGSGSTIKAALKLGRKAIGVELEEERYLQTVSEIEKQ